MRKLYQEVVFYFLLVSGILLVMFVAVEGHHRWKWNVEIISLTLVGLGVTLAFIAIGVTIWEQRSKKKNQDDSDLPTGDS